MSLVVLDMSTGPRVVTLPSITSVPGRILTVKDNGSASATNIATLTPAAGDTYESGVATYLLYTPFAYVTFIGNATTLKWRVLDSTYPDIPMNIPPTPPTPGTLGGVTGSLTNLTVSGLTSLGNSSNTGNLGVAGITTLNTLGVTGNAAFSTINAYNINFTSSITSNGLPFTSGVSATSGFAQVTNLPAQTLSVIAFDPSNNMYVGDGVNGVIYKITPQGQTSLLAGSGVAGYSDGIGSAASFTNLYAMIYDPWTNGLIVGNLAAVRWVSLTGQVITIAGSTTSGNVPNSATPVAGSAARFTTIFGLCGDGSGNYYISDHANHNIKKITLTSQIVTSSTSSSISTCSVSFVAGSYTGLAGYVNDIGSSAFLNDPRGITINPAKTHLFFADRVNNVYRAINISTGAVTTVAGSGTGGTTGANLPGGAAAETDSTTAANVQFNGPIAACCDSSGNLLLTTFMPNPTGGNTLRYININYTSAPVANYTLTLAGSNGFVGAVAGVGTNSRMFYPICIAFDIYGSPWIVSQVTPAIFNYNLQTGYLNLFYEGRTTLLPTPANIQNTAISTIVTKGVATETIFGSGFTSLNSGVTYQGPLHLTVDSQNNIYVGDVSKIRRIEASGRVISVFGDPSNTQGSLMTGTGAQGQMPNSFIMCLDTSGNMYIVSSNTLSTNLYKLNLTTGTMSSLGNPGSYLTNPFGIIYNNNILYIASRGVSYAGGFIISYNILTTTATLIAGSTTASGSTNNATGTSATFNLLCGICFDATKANLFCADYGNNLIRRVSLTSPYAVSTLTPSSGSITLLNPFIITSDSLNNLYVSELITSTTIKKIPYNASSQTYGPSSNFGSGFNSPRGLTVDSYNNIYVADSTNDVIYYITPSGISSVYSGNIGISGTQDSTYASSLTLLAPYVGIGKTNPQYPLDIGVVTNFNSNVNFSTNTRITTTSGFAQINLTLPSSRGICFDPSGNMYVNSSYLYTIYKITPQGQTSLLAGSYGLAGTTDGTGSAALFINSPQQMCYDSYTGCIAMANATALRLISLTGVVTTIASGFTTNYGVCSDGAGNFYITDDHRIKKVAISSPTPAANSGVVTTIAGTGTPLYINGPGASANFWSPYHIVINSSKTAVYVADITNNVIRQVNLTSPFTVTTLAGAAPTGGPAATPGSTDSTTATSVSFTSPVSMAIDASNNIYVGDYGNNRVRYINVSPFYTLTIGGDGTTGALSGVGTNSKINTPHGMTVDPYGGLWVVSYDNGSIYSYNSKTGYFNLLFQNTNTAPKPINIQNTSISTIVAPAIATGTLYGSGFTITNSNAANPGGATYQSPNGVLMDSQNNLYVCDNRRLRKITPSGLVTSVYGDVTNTQGTTQEGTAVEGVSNILYQSLCFDNSGNVYVSQFAGNSILRINLTTGVGTNLAITGQALNGPNGMLFNNNILYVINENKGGSGFTQYSSYVVAINLATNVSVIVAGSLTNTAIFNFAFSMCFDSTKTNIYVSNYSNGSGNIKIIANYANTGSYPITPTTFATSGLAGLNIFYITSDNLGNFYASGTYTGIPVTRGVIKITSAGVASSFCNTVTLSGATVNIGVATGLAVDVYNNVYFADANRLFIGIITPGGSGSVYSGSNGVTGTQDSTYASSITLMAPYVGINTANPTSALHVNGNANIGVTNNQGAVLNIGGGAGGGGTGSNMCLSYLTGGYNHYIMSRHNSVDQGIYFYINNSAFGVSTAPGTGNAFIASITNTGIYTSFLEVGSSRTLSYGAGSFFAVGSAGQTIQATGAASQTLSITAPNFIFSGQGFIAASDERIKKNIVPVTDSLDVVNKLNLVSFDYIDIIQHKSAKHGLIAQQVKEVYPEAVIKTKDFIPSVFNLATSYEKTDDNVTITSSVPTGFSVKDNIRLYISDDTTYENEEKYETEVLEIISDTQFVVKAWDKYTTGKVVFIYGKKVDDFLSVDKPLIGLIAAGACKVLSGQVSTLQLESSQLSTITGEQFSTLQTESSQLSTITGEQFSTLQGDSLNTSTITGEQVSTLQGDYLNQQSTIAGLQATITTILEKYPV